MQKLASIFIQKHTRPNVPNPWAEGSQKTAFLLPDKNNALLTRTLSAEWCLSNRQFCTPDSFIMKTMSKVQRDDGNIFDIANNQHAQKIQSKAYLIEDNISKLTQCDYLLSLTTATTSSAKETIKPQPFHN